jgi:lysyl-tRNA synthetase, class II
VSDEPRDALPEQMRVRRAKYDRLPGLYPVSAARTRSLADIRAGYPDLAPETSTGDEVGITGRVIFMRNTGKLCFATLRENGVELQVMLSLDRLGASALAAWKADVDLGDLVFVKGEVVSPRSGELSVRADSYRITAKALRPLPVAHKPLSEEMRVRQRYVDLVVRPEAREMVLTRANVLRSIRETLHRLDYVEVETPVLQLVSGGAVARPFRTHMNAFDMDMSLRIATELYLKRCIVGGIERVYEMGKVFRNEGVDSTHSPEYTLLEVYQAYGDYDTIAELTRALVQAAARAAGVSAAATPDGATIELFGEWQSVRLHDAVSGALGEHVTADTPADEMRAYADKHDVAVMTEWTAGEIVVELFEKLVEHTIIQPTFVRDYPVEVRPLARSHPDDARLAATWDLIIGGVEIGTGYSELVDPVVQRRRLVEQSVAATKDDPETMQVDDDFLRALEYGMPPTGGLGMGVDRLVMLLTGRGIRETILFPLLKPL